MQIVDGVVRNAPQLLGTRRALPQNLYQCMGTGDEVGVAGLRGGCGHGANQDSTLTMALEEADLKIASRAEILAIICDCGTG